MPFEAESTARKEYQPSPAEEILLDRNDDFVRSMYRDLYLLNGGSGHDGKMSRVMFDLRLGNGSHGPSLFAMLSEYKNVLVRNGIFEIDNHSVQIHPRRFEQMHVQQELVAERLRQADFPELNLDRMEECVDQTQRALSATGPFELKKNRQLAARQAELSLADAAGLITLRKGLVYPGNLQVNKLDEQARKLLLFLIYALHSSEHIEGVSQGWNRVLIPGQVVYDNISATRYQPVGDSWHVKQLAQKGYILPATPPSKSGPRDAFFLCMQPENGIAFRDDQQYKEWLRNNRKFESLATQVVNEVFANGREVKSITDMPPDIRLASQAEILAVMRRVGLPFFASIHRLGYVLNAANPHLRFAHNGGPERKFYFVSPHRESLETWQETPTYQEWVRTTAVKKELLLAWQEKMQKHCQRPAAYIADQFQPAYVVSDVEIEKAHGGIFAMNDLSRLGYVVPAHKAISGRSDDLTPRYYLMFSDPAKGLVYKKELATRLPDQNKQIEAASIEFYDWLVKTMTTGAEWQTLPNCPGAEQESPSVKLVAVHQLKQLLKDYPPLTQMLLSRRGYMIKGQSSHPTSAYGVYVFCPGGTTQSERVRSTGWYQNMIQSNSSLTTN